MHTKSHSCHIFLSSASKKKREKLNTFFAHDETSRLLIKLKIPTQMKRILLFLLHSFLREVSSFWGQACRRSVFASVSIKRSINSLQKPIWQSKLTKQTARPNISPKNNRTWIKCAECIGALMALLVLQEGNENRISNFNPGGLTSVNSTSRYVKIYLKLAED